MADEGAGQVRLKSACGRGVLFATTLGSGMAFLDGLVVNVALPKMDRTLGLGVAGLQWTVSGFLLTVSALLLLGGSIGDVYGRRRTYVAGIVLFAITSMACGLAPNAVTLVIARMVQGVAGALMIPSSLAIIESAFVPEDRGGAIGAWTGLSALFTSFGPFVGGVFVTYLSWRVSFFINLPLAVLAVLAAYRWVPESVVGRSETKRLDWTGGVLGAVGLAAVTYWAIEGANRSQGHAPLAVGIGGFAVLAAFIAVESKVRDPMLPLGLFRLGGFGWVNLCTVIFYGAFVTGVTFLAVQLQTNLGYSALAASVASFPVTICMIVLSRRWGAWGQRVGVQWPMALGPALVAVALVGMSQIHDGRHYWPFVFPAMVVWGLGLSMTVAPLTAAAMAAAPNRAGIASGVNNAASRLGQTIGVSLLPVLAGIGGDKHLGGASFSHGYERLLLIAAGCCAFAGVVAAGFVRQQPQPTS